MTHPVAAKNRSLGRVLLAEDEVIARAVTERLLASAGYTAVTVGDGREALAALKEGDFDLVLMDCSMPVMDGFEAVRAIRADQSGQIDVKIPIIALTALTMEGDPKRCLDAGMDDFVGKPVSREQLLTAIERNLRAGWPAAAKAADGATDEPARPSWDDVYMDGLIDRFLQRVPDTIKDLQRALGRDDHESLQRQAHRLRGAADLIRAKSLSARAGDLEHAAQCGCGERVRRAAAKLVRELDQLTAVADEK